MIYCGIKLTHDGGVCLVEDNKLLFNIEIEKLNNNPRYSEIGNLDSIVEILESNGYTLDSVDRFIIDGWHSDKAQGKPVLERLAGTSPLQLEVAAYNEVNVRDNILEKLHVKNGLKIAGHVFDYTSYMHVSGHVLGAYCTSPFARGAKNAFVLVWDGGQYPRLYYVNTGVKQVVNLGFLFFLHGTFYSIIGHYFGPYKKTPEQLSADAERQDLEGYFGGYSIAGKIMSYLALGEVKTELLNAIPALYRQTFEVSDKFEHKFAHAIQAHASGKGYSDADILSTVHTYIENLLVDSLKKQVEKHNGFDKNICLAGGSFLNIKWNSAIRNSGVFGEVYVPPFPNDSGSALGMCCCEIFVEQKQPHLLWSVYSGPGIVKDSPQGEWEAKACDLKQLANIIHTTGKPVVFLNGKAEAGPRALGHRSILSAAASPAMKEQLNKIKRRESFRPVAPICLEEYAPAIFEPGCKDPFMLFDHKVKREWMERVPAICHLDNTARIQTVAKDNEALYALLQAYYELSGIPLLCNTSANLNGSGFFPSVHSATKWGGVDYVWCEGTLFANQAAISEKSQQANYQTELLKNP